MPVTFFAHQAPVLPVLRRWPRYFDGVALIVGSMAPDIAYVLDGSRFRIWAHGFPAVFTFCVPATVLISWLLVRMLAPVVPDHAPDAGEFHLHDYRGLATHRFGWIATPLSAALGALSHVALDQLTHGWGWPARHLPWYRQSLGSLLDRPVTLFTLLQYSGHVVLTLLCLALLWRYGRDRWMGARAASVPPFPVTVRTQVAVWGAGAVGVVAGVAWSLAGDEGVHRLILRTVTGAFLGLVVGALAARALQLVDRPVVVAGGRRGAGLP